jgi:hypothetical protein
MERCKEVRRDVFLNRFFGEIEGRGDKGQVYIFIWNPLYERLGGKIARRIRSSALRRSR